MLDGKGRGGGVEEEGARWEGDLGRQTGGEEESARVSGFTGRERSAVRERGVWVRLSCKELKLKS